MCHSAGVSTLHVVGASVRCVVQHARVVIGDSLPTELCTVCGVECIVRTCSDWQLYNCNVIIVAQSPNRSNTATQLLASYLALQSCTPSTCDTKLSSSPF